ncbi:septum formation inhibitor [Neokomagataea thailandica NBRC 106555]|uniref:Probable septum site-determining protein MinC n=2 Tax=Neokomagataea TaxID=1223423 RepID=A0A4Y6V6R2_9PROT|nr:MULTISPECIES: septum site-determining protein MinC [Neokomagataea]QDH25759.1 septum formation inhibitor MinC [Neokomagataea tanensis]GBR52842.1 septum formation inhibitor [Neokomagataea thailandica NBRC 106555]
MSHPQPSSQQTETAPALRIRARGRSFLALVLSPEAPLTDWLNGLDHQIARSGSLFSGKPIILDLDLLAEDTPDLDGFQSALVARGLRIVGIEGGDRSWPAVAQWDWPAPLDGGKAAGPVELPDASVDSAPHQASPPLPGKTLIVDETVRSGQRIQNLEGDVVILGSVSSGAEIVSAGSIHVYGALRGRAIAGITEHSGARIFAQKMEAELLAIDGFYTTADELEASSFGNAAQALLINDQITLRAL